MLKKNFLKRGSVDQQQHPDETYRSLRQKEKSVLPNLSQPCPALPINTSLPRAVCSLLLKELSGAHQPVGFSASQWGG